MVAVWSLDKWFWDRNEKYFFIPTKMVESIKWISSRAEELVISLGDFTYPIASNTI